MVLCISVTSVVCCLKIRRAKKNCKNSVEADPNMDPAYEEVTDTIGKDQKPRKEQFEYNINSCYSLEQGSQDPVYAKIDDEIKMFKNALYGLPRGDHSVIKERKQILNTSLEGASQPRETV
jgi:hypothetical protein